MLLKSLLRPTGYVTRTKHRSAEPLLPKCDSHLNPRRLCRLTRCYATFGAASNSMDTVIPYIYDSFFQEPD
jgi:hypothetical protein